MVYQRSAHARAAQERLEQRPDQAEMLVDSRAAILHLPAFLRIQTAAGKASWERPEAAVSIPHCDSQKPGSTGAWIHSGLIFSSSVPLGHSFNFFLI